VNDDTAAPPPCAHDQFHVTCVPRLLAFPDTDDGWAGGAGSIVVFTDAVWYCPFDKVQVIDHVCSVPASASTNTGDDTHTAGFAV
jgi:hypothetical protein